ncbi:hypothetical protein EW145_g575 [Phellinidium pouzarii]|uniref:Uncharacterized protein n=1 Tax=Phellinidium pouzarii TaxID=167371 RepID=A0A4S4LJI1_9AGAM|nr:hypothetical protein EW145_g575 [Phellinidium pouzarii]
MIRKRLTRWLSQDLMALENEYEYEDEDEDGRLQGRRRGCDKSPLLGDRCVIGKSLRAAGLTRRRGDGDDIFANAEADARPAEKAPTSERPGPSVG